MTKVHPLKKMIEEAFEKEPSFKVKYHRATIGKKRDKPEFQWLYGQLDRILGQDRISEILQETAN